MSKARYTMTIGDIVEKYDIFDFDQNFTGGYTMLEFVNKMLEFNILVFDYIKTLPNLNTGPQGQQGEQGPQGPQGPKGDKGLNGGGFGSAYGNGEPWELPTANKTFTYFITAVENKALDTGDVYFEGVLKKDSYTPSILCDANFGDTFIVSYGGDSYYVFRFEQDGTFSEYTYTPAQQGDDQLALSSNYLKAVRIL